MSEYQIMPFPKREWELLKHDLITKGRSSSTRCCKELNKYKVNAIYNTPWGDLIKIIQVTRYIKPEDILTWKYFDKGMKISARIGAKYGNSQWDYVIFKKTKKKP